ncbi:MAG: hypothetical protein ACOYNY_02070 [Caldilineaceae bacterium]
MCAELEAGVQRRGELPLGMRINIMKLIRRNAHTNSAESYTGDAATGSPATALYLLTNGRRIVFSAAASSPVRRREV